MKERDRQLDCYRALIMIYIVCVIHTFWFYICKDIMISLALFEMPVIFFIAGAAQSFKKKHELKTTIISRTKRILIPYYIFLFFLLAFFYICTLLGITYDGHPIDIYQLNARNIIKMLITGGSDKLPYYGYTWFISVYFIISCSLPIQAYVINRLSGNVYILIILCCFILWKTTGIKSPENIIENLLCYDFFYIAGLLYYKKLQKYKLILISIIPVIVSFYAFISGIAIPMQDHKFPPDVLFLTYTLGVLCILSLIIGNLNIKYNTVMRIWNERGYTIYLYQNMSHFIIYKITINWISGINNSFIQFIIYFFLAFIVCTIISYVTYPTEKYIKDIILNSSIAKRLLKQSTHIEKP